MSSLISYYSPLDRVFDRAFGSLLPAVNGDASFDGALKLDVVETPEAYVVKAEVPGVAKDKIDVKVESAGFTASLTLRTTGNKQTVQISSQGDIRGVSITMVKG